MAFGEYFNAMSSFPATAKTAAELRDQNYRYQQARAQGRAYRASVDPKTGKPIGTAFIQNLINEGVDIDPATAQAARMAEIYKTGNEAAQAGVGMESLGAKPRTTILAQPDEIQAAQERQAAPSFFGRLFAKPQATKVEQPAVAAEPLSGTTDAQGNPTTNAYDFLTAAPATKRSSPTGPSDIGATAVPSSTSGTENRAAATEAAQPAPVAEESTALAVPGSDRNLGSLGSSRITAPTEGKLPPIEVERANPPVDDYFSAMLRDVSLQSSQQAAGNGVQGQAPDESLFAWNPQNDGSNAYTQYQAALDSQLKASGFNSASDYLKSVYTGALQSNVPPRPSAMLRATAPGEYYKAEAAWQSGMQQAQGKAQQAVIEARGKLADFAKQYGLNLVEQRKTEIGSNQVLRDPSKRTEAAALLTNRENIKSLKTDLANAGTDIAKLQLIAPTAIRAYATSLNPGQQLSEGNLREVGMTLYPEFGNSEQLMTQLAAGILLSFKGDNSVLESFAKKAEQMGGAPLSARLTRLVDHADILNEKTLDSYVTGVKAPTTDSVTTQAQAPNASASAMQAAGVSPERISPSKPKTPVKPKPARNPRASSKGR